MWTPTLKNSGQPLYLQLVEQMAQDIASGKLAAGQKLPPQRQLAWHLEINLSTVTKAFQQAAKQHLISGEVGRGTYVLAQSFEAQLFLLKQDNTNTSIDLSTHVPASRAGDDELALTLNEMIAADPSLSQYLSYHSPQALKRVQVMAAKWLMQLGYLAKPQNCIATTTAQNALLVILLACCGKDDVILVNEFTFPGMKTIAKQLGLKLYGVAMDEQGIIPAALDLAIRTSGSKILVSDPLMQNPTACSMTQARSTAIKALIVKHNILFIEEYVIGAVSQSAPISGSIKQYSLLITSFSKAVCPGVRFAVITGESPMINDLVKQSHATSWHLSPLMAEVACRWIESGVTKRRNLWQWQEIGRRFRLFKKIFPPDRYAGNTQISSHVWLTVTGELGQSLAMLTDLGIIVVPASVFAVGRNIPNNIRVSLTAAKSIQQLKIALTILVGSGLVSAAKQ